MSVRSGLWECRSAFFAVVDGRRVAVSRGALVPRDVPYSVMDGREDWFAEVGCVEEPIGPFKLRGRGRAVAEPVVEQATAAPGEVRRTSTRRKGAPADPGLSVEAAAQVDVTDD